MTEDITIPHLSDSVDIDNTTDSHSTDKFGDIIKAKDPNVNPVVVVTSTCTSTCHSQIPNSAASLNSMTKVKCAEKSAVLDNVYRPGQLPGRTKKQLNQFRASLGASVNISKHTASMMDNVVASTLDSLIFSTDLVKNKAKGLKRNNTPLKRKVSKSQSQYLKKKKMFPVPVETVDKSSDVEALEKINAYSMALEMGYSEPNVKIVCDNSSKQIHKDMLSDLEEEDVGKKALSPVENIQQVIEYMINCTCACLTPLSVQDIASHRLKLTTMEHQNRDYFIMGLLCSSFVSTTKANTNHVRQRHYYQYRFQNIRICQVCFLFVNNVREKYIKRLKKHFLEEGPELRANENQCRKPHNALNTEEVTDVIDFILK